jgi:hypothetical protein
MLVHVLNKIMGLLLFVAAAGVVATLLGLFVHDGLGLSRHTIRSDALISAALLVGLILVEVLSSRFGRKK